MQLQMVRVHAAIGVLGVGLPLVTGCVRHITSDAGKVTNNKLFNALITAAIRDKSTTPVNFGMGTGTGTISGMLA